MFYYHIESCLARTHHWTHMFRVCTHLDMLQHHTSSSSVSHSCSPAKFRENVKCMLSLLHMHMMNYADFRFFDGVYFLGYLHV